MAAIEAPFLWAGATTGLSSFTSSQSIAAGLPAPAFFAFFSENLASQDQEDDIVADASFGGLPMRKVADSLYSPAADRVLVYHVVNPPDGTNDFVVNFTGTGHTGNVVVLCCSNVHPDYPMGVMEVKFGASMIGGFSIPVVAQSNDLAVSALAWTKTAGTASGLDAGTGMDSKVGPGPTIANGSGWYGVGQGLVSPGWFPFAPLTLGWTPTSITGSYVNLGIAIKDVNNPPSVSDRYFSITNREISQPLTSNMDLG